MPCDRPPEPASEERRRAIARAWLAVGAGILVALLAYPAVATEEKKPEDGTEEKSDAAEKGAQKEETPPTEDNDAAEGGGPAGEGAPVEKKGEAGEDPAPLRFTDEDLMKYKRPPGTDKPEERPQRPPGAAPRTPAKRTPVEIATPPKDDPLKPFRDREAKEAFRAEQLRTLRGRIEQLESRLAYLEQKRLAILDPLRIMPQAQTAEDRTLDAGASARELLDAVEEEIETVKGGLKQAREQLIGIETRFAAEAGSR